MIKLGCTVRDTITGFTGVVTGRVQYITECAQALIQPPVDKEGKFVDSQWIDEPRLEVGDQEVVVIYSGATPGPDKPAPKR